MLEKLLKELEDNLDHSKSIHIPKVWNCLDLQHEKYDDGVITVNENSFVLDTIKSFYKEEVELSDKPWLKGSVAYSMMVRASTTFDYNQDGVIDDSETGSFIRTIMLLPYLKQMGVTMLYMLPISKYSTRDKKGELGSVYGVSNFFEFDPSLKAHTTLTIEEEFACLVEAAHMNGIRVVIDIIPRTNSVESELIMDHPDWFYWIKDSEYEQYGSPEITEIGNHTQVSSKVLETVYNSPNTKKHLDMFVENPMNHPEWNTYKHDLELVRKHLGVRVAPAFSDHINDPQPPWTDVTFFRLYMDHPNESKQYLDREYPPYILFDTIKGNVFQGEIKNEALWEILSDIIPFYQSFGVDGARIDMGHALPKELTEMIISKAKANNPNFIFIAEEMNPSNAKHAKRAGYDMIIGDGFWKLPRYEEGHTSQYYKDMVDLDLPVFACGETHDTRRLAARVQGEEQLSRIITILNMFAPNSIPFINSGQELYEKQPMNLGVDCGPNEDENLPESDPFYKKLALFDKYQFHYTAETDLIDILTKIKDIRLEHLDYIQNGKYKVKHKHDCLSLEYKLDDKLVIVANFSDQEIEVNGEVLFSTNKENKLKPKEVMILKVEKKWRK